MGTILLFKLYYECTTKLSHFWLITVDVINRSATTTKQHTQTEIIRMLMVLLPSKCLSFVPRQAVIYSTNVNMRHFYAKSPNTIDQTRDSLAVSTKQRNMFFFLFCTTQSN